MSGGVDRQKVTDVSSLISLSVYRLLEEAALDARKIGLNEADPLFILETLFRRRNLGDLASIVSQLGGSVQALKEFLKDYSPSKLRPFSGVVTFSPEVRESLLLAVVYANRASNGQSFLKSAEIPDFVAALFLAPKLRGLYGKINLSGDYLLELERILRNPSKKDEYGSKVRLTSDLSAELSKKEIFDREREAEELLRTLSRQKKNNLILLGEPGVGKKAAVMAALKLLRQTEPDAKPFLSLDLETVSLAGLERDWTEELSGEIKEKKPLAIIVENIEILKTREAVGAFLNFIFNLHIQAEVRFILLATPVFYGQFLQSDVLVSQNFEVLKIEELPREILLKVLGKIKVGIEDFHKVSIAEAAFPELLSLCARFLKDEALPQKAASVLEETASAVRLSGRREVGLEDILKIISQKSGVPSESLTVSEKEKLARLAERLSVQVIGQTEAVKKVSEAVRRSRAGLKDPKKPIGSFLFLGPTGVGKTELAKALARTVFDSEKAFVRLDMSEYGEAHTTQRLIGAPPGYVGFEEGGQLTNPVLERPYSLILLDEIEKAHPKVFDLFLQVLDDGRLTDAQGRLVDFKNTIIIATSNLAQDEILEGEYQYNSSQLASQSNVMLGALSINSDSGQARMTDKKKFFEQKIMPKLRENFRPEFINRFDEIIVFRALNKDDLFKIAQIKLGEITGRLAEKGITLKIKDGTIRNLVDSSFDVRFGARPLARKIRDEVENLVAEKIIGDNLGEGDTVEI
ncbi:MAG: ATP-dependent Clp protease ATP-binding subunit [Patescibacteria group bacterium]|nr:ATP-dependent Clp protease ATP-binding subunit [Patescibacteria group bacterium]